MSRYSNQKVKTTSYKLLRGKEIPIRRFIETTIHIDRSDEDDLYINVQRGDRLDNLSVEHYGTPEYWYIIANANNIKDSFFITNESIIKIPYFNPGYNDSDFILENELR
jgi:hypothetical protein